MPCRLVASAWRRRQIPFANLQAWCEWWVDKRNGVACCQTAELEVLETEPQLFDCDDCELKCAQANLWPENAEAWAIFVSVARRFVADVHLGAYVLERQLADYTTDDALDILERLSLIYDLVSPAPAAED